MREFNRLLCESAPGGRLLERDGVLATVIPVTPERSAMNSVVYRRAGALAVILDELAAAYDEAGVEAWLVWVPGTDGAARRLLKRAGHRLAASNIAMARELGAVEPPRESALADWTPGGDPRAMATICDRAFDFGTAFGRSHSTLPTDRVHVYLARLDDEPVSCVAVSDHEGNSMVDAVATVPEARGRGLAGALLEHALADARDRGCTTTTLVATPAARPLYRRLGYRDLAALEQWERRS
jgi:GNAT superfamily N-acetyltransferase